MTVNTNLPPDQAARDRITGALDTTMFVQAAAGSGKTKALVDRVLELIDGGVDVSKIAAITFTERAAGELRDRIRRALRDSIDRTDDEVARERRVAAIADIDDAAIGTLHGFALRLLAEHPIEAGLPIVFRVRDEIASEITEDAAWDRRADVLLADASLADDIDVLDACGVSFDKIRELGESMDGFWDQITAERFTKPGPVNADEVIKILLRTLELVGDIESECTNPDNKLLIEMTTVARPYADDLRAAAGPGEIVSVLARGKPTFKWGGKGAKGDWPDIDAARALGADLLEARDGALQALVENSIRRIVCAMAQEVVEEASRRIAEGALSYDDLLVLARKLLTDSPGGAVRQALHERYTHLLLDEFQDTDPLQLDIAMRLTADPEIELPAGDLAPLAGRLFVVGDPQQSIYGFRGADLALYLRTGERITNSTPPIGELQSLSTNFRTVGPVVDWINDTFDGIILERELSQPPFERLDSHRGNVGLDGPAVVQLGEQPHPYGTKVETLRIAEGCDIAAVISDCMGHGEGPAWQIETEDRGAAPARLEDISILLPRRTALPQITDALDAAGIPYRTESSGLAYASDEVRALIATLRAIDDFDDALALVNALRSPLFGCGDDDLMRFGADEQTHWRIDADVDHLDPSDPVADAIGYLRQLARQNSWSSPAALLDTIVRDRRLFELAHVDSRPRDLWRRVRFVIDQARSWSASGGGSLGDYIVWAERQMDDDNKVNEAILPETDDDAVRLLTVHASKGLEFPVVICAGLANVAPKTRGDAKVEVFDGGFDFTVGSKLSSTGWSERHASDSDLEDDELRRLLYVACTRARDHLVFSTHRVLKRGDVPGEDLAWLLAESSEPTLVEAFEPREAERIDATTDASETSLPAYADWHARLTAALDAAKTPDAVAVTQLAKSTEAEAAGEPATAPEQLAAPIDDSAGASPDPVRRTRAGTSFGSAVHGVLELIDPTSPDQANGLAAIQAFVEGVEHDGPVVATLAKHALASDIIKEAASAQRWTELFVCGELDGTLCEGIVDLLFEADDGLVIVDYKTDNVTAAEFAAKAVEYRFQVASYARLVKAITGRDVVRGVLLHLTEHGATEHAVSI